MFVCLNNNNKKHTHTKQKIIIILQCVNYPFCEKWMHTQCLGLTKAEKKQKIIEKQCQYCEYKSDKTGVAYAVEMGMEVTQCFSIAFFLNLFLFAFFLSR